MAASTAGAVARRRPNRAGVWRPAIRRAAARLRRSGTGRSVVERPTCQLAERAPPRRAEVSRPAPWPGAVRRAAGRSPSAGSTTAARADRRGTSDPGTGRSAAAHREVGRHHLQLDVGVLRIVTAKVADRQRAFHAGDAVDLCCHPVGERPRLGGAADVGVGSIGADADPEALEWPGWPGSTGSRRRWRRPTPRRSPPAAPGGPSPVPGAPSRRRCAGGRLLPARRRCRPPGRRRGATRNGRR